MENETVFDIMSINEFKNKREGLEKRIENLLANFQEDNKCFIDDVEIKKIDKTSTGLQMYEVKIKSYL